MLLPFVEPPGLTGPVDGFAEGAGAGLLDGTPAELLDGAAS
ncbi:hypothetical protein ACFFON_05735 [Arthrobacter citreus]|nr:hypothetical protein [Arthrobacter gandavensis]